MSKSDVIKKIREYIPSKVKPLKNCPLCGKPYNEFDRLRGKHSCQILTSEDLQKKMTI